MSFNTQTLFQDVYAEGRQVAKWEAIVKIGSEELKANSCVNVASQTYAQSLNGEVTDLTSVSVDLSPFALSSTRFDKIKAANGETDVAVTIKADGEVVATLTGKGVLNKAASTAQMAYFQPFAGSGKIGDKAVNVGGETA